MDRAERELNWERIETFVGYGRIDAPVVFIGMEEGLATGDDLEADLRRRSSYEKVMGLWEPHQAAAKRCGQNFDAASEKLRPTWRVMSDLMLRKRNKNIKPTTAERRAYQATELGSLSGETLSTELLPYPHNRASDWEYARFGRYETRDEYLADLLPKRTKMLSDLLSKWKREAVICYGRQHSQHYRALFGNSDWQNTKPFEFADVGETRVVITPHFTSQTFAGKEAELAAIAFRL